MKLIRFGTIENEKPGVILKNGEWADTSSFGEDYDEHFFQTHLQYISALAGRRILM